MGKKMVSSIAAPVDSYLIEFLDEPGFAVQYVRTAENIPVRAQFSGYSPGIDMAAALNDIIRREPGTDDRYFALLDNSSTEAIEIAIKNAKFDCCMRIMKLVVDLVARDVFDCPPIFDEIQSSMDRSGIFNRVEAALWDVCTILQNQALNDSSTFSSSADQPKPPGWQAAGDRR